jgi:hypothetical protein
MGLERDGNYYVEWKDIELEMGEVQGGQNCEYMVGEEFGIIGREACRNYSMDRSDIEMQTGEVLGGQL